jgi:hypothetical protein
VGSVLGRSGVERAVSSAGKYGCGNSEQHLKSLSQSAELLSDLKLSELSALLGHIVANVPENEIDGSAGQSLELDVIFVLPDSCQQTVEDVSRQ